MKTSFTFLICATSLVIALPGSERPDRRPDHPNHDHHHHHHHPHHPKHDAHHYPKNMTSPMDISKRILKTSNCGLAMYPNADQQSVLHGLYALDADTDHGDSPTPRIIFGWPGKCKTFYCDGTTEFRLCINKEKITGEAAFSADTFLKALNTTYNDCYGGPPADSDAVIRAFQYWGDGYNLLVRGTGGAECSS